MESKNYVVINCFNRKSFEKFTTVNQDTGEIQVICQIDGLTVEHGEWARLQEEAIKRDLTNLGLRNQA